MMNPYLAPVGQGSNPPKQDTHCIIGKVTLKGSAPLKTADTLLSLLLLHSTKG